MSQKIQKIKKFEIQDSQIDTEEIEKIVAAGIKQRRQEAENQSFDFERLAQMKPLEEEQKLWLMDVIDHHKADILISVKEIPSSEGRFSQLIGWIKGQLHKIAIYYANMVGKRQIAFNESVAHLIKIQQERIAHLEAKVDRLEAQRSDKETE